MIYSVYKDDQYRGQIVMKKILALVLIIMALFCEVSYGAEYLNGVEFKETSIYDDDIMWSGREWVTDEYPPKISQDAVEFTEIEGSEEAKTVLQGKHFTYLWTGNDYLAYEINHNYYSYQKPKYLYRITEDFDKILNVYEAPNWINSLEFFDGKAYITTEEVCPNKDGDRVLSISIQDREIYYSDNFTEWTKIPDINPLAEHHIHKIKDKLLIDRSFYSDDSMNKILYENFSGISLGKLGQYLCYVDFKNENNSPNNSVLAFSNDGIYWAYLITDKRIEIIPRLLDIGDNIVLRDSKVDYTCNKEDIYSQLREKLPSDPVYVRLNGNYLGFEYPPVIESDRTLVPMRFLFEQMGADVTWNQERKEATATMGDTVIRFGIDNTTATVNGEEVTMDVPARLINDKTMVPLRFLSENMGYNVDWDSETRTAIIEK